ncbi:hypothetical protein E2H14_24630, partial [Salmonella enterica subsp. enterica serovar Muenchen]|nr:hypothetical protein [Salmonella enterica subsp. enterica serovar Muenchen]
AGAATSGTINIPFTLNNPQQTCDLTFDNGSTMMTYQLGAMDKGTQKRHQPFNINVICSGNGSLPKTALTVRNTTGIRQNGNDSVMMRVNGQQSTNGPLFWLENAGWRLKLTGAKSDAFCGATAPRRVCQLRPVTSIPANSNEGNIDVTVVFDVVYLQ